MFYPLCALFFLAAATNQAVAFSVMSMNADATETSRLARARLHEALYSPSGKLTLSPEIVIPEPTDPTAILLQASGVTTLSEKIRTKAKANAAGISGSLNSVRIFVTEQERARGNFPGPVPVIYCGSIAHDNVECDELMSELSDVGASGVLVSVLDGKEVSSIDDIASDEGLAATCSSALKNGVQPIPEVVLPEGSRWSEEDMEALVHAVRERCGLEPVAVVLTMNVGEKDESSEDDVEESSAALPKVPKALGKKIPIIGSIRVVAGENRMGTCVAQLKEAGFTGGFLRSDCVPGFRMNPDLDIVGNFWSAAIGDLKSVKSKSFGFRSKVQLERDVPLEWYNYQKSVMESGALGSPGGGSGDATDFNPDQGDFKGF